MTNYLRDKAIIDNDTKALEKNPSESDIILEYNMIVNWKIFF